MGRPGQPPSWPGVEANMSMARKSARAWDTSTGRPGQLGQERLERPGREVPVAGQEDAGRVEPVLVAGVHQRVGDELEDVGELQLRPGRGFQLEQQPTGDQVAVGGHDL